MFYRGGQIGCADLVVGETKTTKNINTHFADLLLIIRFYLQADNAADLKAEILPDGQDFISCCFVGVARFELTTSSTPCWRDTGLRYTPKKSLCVCT